MEGIISQLLLVPALADYFIYIIDVTGGVSIQGMRGLGIETCDPLVINKIDFAPLVGADLSLWIVVEIRRMFLSILKKA